MENRDERLTALEAAVKSAESKLKNAEIDVMAIQNEDKATPVIIPAKMIKDIYEKGGVIHALKTAALGIVTGDSGSGKSVIVKREICNVFLATDDDIVICDPEDEYYPLVQDFGGQVIELSTSSLSFEDEFPRDTKLYKLMTTKPLKSEI